MKAIVACTSNRGIGYKGDLLFHISDDMKRFKELTEGNIVIMGRRTFESLPGKNPLRNRTNVVLSHSYNYHARGSLVVHSVEEIENDIMQTADGRDIFVIGGGEIYRLLLPLCDTVYMTVIEKEVEADAFFPILWQSEWNCGPEDQSDRFYDEDNQVFYQYLTYHRR